MCDYSLHNVKSRPAKVDDKLTTHRFKTGTTGFAAAEDTEMAVCVLPGTELAFAAKVSREPNWVFSWKPIIFLTPQPSSDKSTRITRVHIMMRLNFQTVRLCC